MGKGLLDRRLQARNQCTRQGWGEVPLQTEGGGSETERVLARADVAQLQGEYGHGMEDKVNGVAPEVAERGKTTRGFGDRGVRGTCWCRGV